MKISSSEQYKQYPALKSLKPLKKKLCISTMEGQNIIYKQDIYYLKADNNYCIIHYNDKKLVCSLTLKVLSARLYYTNFIRVHRSFVINFDKIRFINSAYTSIIMEDGIIIPISRSYKQAVKSQIEMSFD